MMHGGLIIAGSWSDLIAFEVHDVSSESRAAYHDAWPGALRPKLEWKTDVIEPATQQLAAQFNFVRPR